MRKNSNEQGNALFIVIIAIAVLGMLSYAVMQSSEQPTAMADDTARDEQIARMFAYAATTAGTLNQMIAAGADANTLYTTLDTTAPTASGFSTAPFNTKLYHPLGGGLNYVTSSGAVTSSATVATTYGINKASIITDVGQSNATIGDMPFTAVITNAPACERINYMLTGSIAMPVMDVATYQNLFLNNVTVTLNAATCADCVAKAQICVVNSDTTGWGYYSALLPG